jgi:hypothetical protein
MLGCYKKHREDIVKIIKKSPKTEDGYYICKNFINLNKALGEIKDEGYIYNRSYYENKICFNEASYALLIYYVKKEEQTLDYIKEVIGI